MCNLKTLVYLKEYRSITLVIGLVFIVMFNVSCTYERTRAAGVIQIQLSAPNEGALKLAVIQFADEYGLNFNNHTRSYPSGARPIFFQLDVHGETLIQVNDLMDAQRFVIAFYGNKKQDWELLFDVFYPLLKSRFPDAKIKSRKAGESVEMLW